MVDERFVAISNLNKAGLSLEEEPQLFYQHAGFKELTQFIDKIVAGCHVGLIDGLPGIGKSSTLWSGLQKLASRSLLWIHLDQLGNVTDVVKVQGTSLQSIPVPTTAWSGFLAELPKILAQSTILVFDGVNHNIYNDALVATRDFVMKDLKTRCGFITMSNKIKREHKHNLEIFIKKQRDGLFVAQFHHTQHSWTLDDYLGALVNPDGTATPLFLGILPVFAAEWNVDVKAEFTNTKPRLGGSKKYVLVEEAVAQKFAYCGGSARWMASETTRSISTMISSYLQERIQPDSLVNFTLGQESPFAKTHLYYSTQDENGLTVYSLASQHAAYLAVKGLCAAGTKSLYQHATRLNNPAFLGWVIEADIMQRCVSGALFLEAKGGSAVQFTEQGQDPIEFDHDELVNGALVESLIPEEGKTNVCKPKKWNQGGYDIIFVTARSGKKLVLRLGQVTKSTSHSLKLKYFAEVVSFLKNAGYAIESVEIAFIVPQKLISDFRVLPSKVFGRGLLSHVDLPSTLGKSKWDKGKEEELVTVYGVDLMSPTCIRCN
uniref:Uncharacterized protein n=1 Tax=Entomoneis paludosa TaxID=265537 RepID=A0A7S2YU35_9STRA|mmetsp:Transcript_9965/g.20612  ORF Transcript_9965/g.20612 Transcript_9965/m.20612 type:complete len:546 (+) Transcript_9965:14-1651(+)